MRETLNTVPLDSETRTALREFFNHSSAYLVDKGTPPPENAELIARWHEQLILDRAIATISSGRDAEAVAIVPHFANRPSVYVGLLARMIRTGRTRLIAFVASAIESDHSVGTHRSAGKTLLHVAAGAGCLEIATLLLRVGVDPDILDSDTHTPLYRVANECATEQGPEIVKALVHAGANINRHTGVTRATALHMAARRGHLTIAQTLLALGADLNAMDRKGETPLQRAINCRRPALAELFHAHGAPASGNTVSLHGPCDSAGHASCRYS